MNGNEADTTRAFLDLSFEFGSWESVALIAVLGAAAVGLVHLGYDLKKLPALLRALVGIFRICGRPVQKPAKKKPGGKKRK